MDRSLLQHFERELRFIRELGAEFARKFPKAAGRLGVTEMACDDPHVERLLQGFAFLSAGVSQRLDAEFPRFTAELMQSVYPQYLAPTPSMVVVQFEPSGQAGALSGGYLVPRATSLRTRVNQRGVSACEFRTAHAVELWPIELEEIEYTSVLRDIADLHVPSRQPFRALVRLRLKTTHGRPFNQLRLERLPLFLRGDDERTARLHEALIAQSSTVVARWGRNPSLHTARSTAARPVRAMGFEEDEALLPCGPTSFRAYRLLQEHFAFPTRFHFVELTGLDAALARCDQDRMDVIVPLTRHDPALQGEIDKQRVLLFTTPAVNLFPRECDRISVGHTSNEMHVVPDRARPLDYEVHSVTRVAAYLQGNAHKIELLPQRAVHGRLEKSRRAHYALERRARVVAYDEQRLGRRGAYPGTELFLRLSDGPAVIADRSCQLSVEALCTNRDLPLSLGLGLETIDFSLDSGAPVSATRCVAGPTAPRAHGMLGERAWRLINQLSLNYLSICQETGGVEALREMLSLNAQLGDPVLQRQAEGIRDVHATPVIRPMPGPGPRTFARGLEITLLCDDQAFATHGYFTLASVLSEFFAKYAPTNSFTETVLRTSERGEIYRWQPVAGLRSIL